MSFPDPVQGLVVRYSCLWRAEMDQGREEGVKDRPCAVILVVAGPGGRKLVTVLPITHRMPEDMRVAVEIPLGTKHRLGLDGERSWVVLSEANRFTWPGPDLRPARAGEAAGSAYDLLPYRLTDEIRLKFIALL